MQAAICFASASPEQLLSSGACAGEGSVSDVFCQSFTAGLPGFGEIMSVPLCENGDDIMVTEDNRRDYVELYINFVLNTSIHKQVQPCTMQMWQMINTQASRCCWLLCRHLLTAALLCLLAVHCQEGYRPLVGRLSAPASLRFAAAMP